MTKAAILLLAFSLCAGSHAAEVFFMGGDPIGGDNSLVDGNGALFAFDGNDQDGTFSFNLGQPGIIITSTGVELLTEIRAIVGGYEFPDTVLPGIDFSKFSMALNFWRLDDYFAGATPEYRTFVEAYNHTYVNEGAEGEIYIFPDAEPFAHVQGDGVGHRLWDMRYDLSTDALFEDPLPPGEWVMSFAMIGDLGPHGYPLLGVSTGAGPVSVNSRTDLPRTYAFVDDVARHALSLTATYRDGDYDHDGDVDPSDYQVWRSSYGQTGAHPADGNDDQVVDAADYTVWRDNDGAGVVPPAGSLLAVPEPGAVALLLLACSCGLRGRSPADRRAAVTGVDRPAH